VLAEVGITLMCPLGVKRLSGRKDCKTEAGGKGLKTAVAEGMPAFPAIKIHA